jgi:hypothetical protein
VIDHFWMIAPVLSSGNGAKAYAPRSDEAFAMG